MRLSRRLNLGCALKLLPELLARSLSLRGERRQLLAVMERDDPIPRVPRPLPLAFDRPMRDDGLPARDLLLHSEPWIALGGVAVFEIRGALILEAEARAASDDGSNQEYEGHFKSAHHRSR